MLAVMSGTRRSLSICLRRPPAVVLLVSNLSKVSTFFPEFFTLFELNDEFECDWFDP